MPFNKILNEYQKSDIFLNMSNTGSLDKVVLEAMACERLVITSNPAYKPVLKKYASLLTCKRDASDLREKISALMKLEDKEKVKLGKYLRKIVINAHNIDRLFDRIVKVIKNEIH